MRWSPYVEFRCGHDQESWERLTAEEQKEIYAASGNRNKPAKTPAVEIADEPELFTERIAFPIRVVSRAELTAMPVFEMFL
jgi:hypothetical protein